MKHFLTLLFTALLAITASGAANVGVGSLPVLSSFTNGQYLVIATGNSSNSPLRLVPFSAVSNGWLSVQKPAGFSASISNVVYLNGASNIVQVLSNAVNNTRYVLARDVFTVTPSKVRSNGLGAINMFHKTNIIVEGDQSVIDGSAALGELLYITNSANITIRGIEFRGRVVTNTTLVSGIGHVWGAVGYHNVREFRFLNNRVIDHHDHGIFDLGSQGGAWAISTNTFINYNFFDNIGSARTNEVIVKDGTAIVPSGGEVIGNYIQNSLRGIEPYIDNSNNPPINQNCIVRGNHIVNMIDDAILTAGNTNMHGLIIEDNVIEWYPGYTRRGSNVITSASGININGGQNVKIVRNRIYYAPNFDIDVPGNFEKFGFVIEDNSGYGYFYGASGGGGLEVTSSSARMPNRGFSIKNNKFEFKRSFGIGLTGIRDSEISGNKLVNTGLDSTRQIWLYSDATTICSNLVLFGNHITSDERDTPTTSGIEIENLTLNTLLAANTIYGQATNVHNLAGAEVTQYNFDASSTNRFAAIRDLNVASNALYSAIGGGAQTPWSSDINGAGNDLTNVSSVVINGASTVAGYTILSGTNDVPVVTQAANSNSVAVTNIVGLLHKAYASVVVLDCNHGSEFRFTNRAASANTTLVLTNLAQGKKINISMLGEISGGTSRTVTIVPQLGYLVGDLDAYGTAPALSKTVTLTNGNGLEISALAKWEIGTNFCDVVTRQYKR